MRRCIWRCHVLQIQEDAAAVQQSKDLRIQRSFPLVGEGMDREARHYGIETPPSSKFPFVLHQGIAPKPEAWSARNPEPHTQKLVGLMLPS